MNTILGHHHISMLTKNAVANNRFYNKILGMRRVKVTVNQDDPSMYHLFYGDKTGAVGTELSFFEMPMAGQTHRGTNAITRIGLFVPGLDSLSFWQKRFDEFGVSYSDITEYGGRTSLLFEDNDGLGLALQVADDKIAQQFDSWDDSNVPAEHQIICMGTVEMTVRRMDKLEKTLTELFDYVKISGDDNERLYRPATSEFLGEILTKFKEDKREKPGRGSVHHLAINVKNDDELQYWHERIIEKGFRSTGIVDRHFFKSLYFRESNGIMFEIATADGPGLTDGIAEDAIGKYLELPPFLEAQRDEIASQLTPVEAFED